MNLSDDENLREQSRKILPIFIFLTKMISTEAQIETLFLELAGFPNLGTTKVELFKTFPFSSIPPSSAPFYFLRTFVPYFYQQLQSHFSQRISDQSDFFATIYQGVCAGDAHCGNFGVSFDANNNAVFSINDFDDSGSTYYYAEFLRFATSCVLQSQLPSENAIPPTDLGSIIESYLTGLGLSAKHDPRKYHTSDSWDTATSLPNPPPLAANAIMVPRLLNALHSIYPTLPITNASFYETTKNNGGSGCLKRYTAFFTLQVDANTPKAMCLEFKQEILPSVLPLYTGSSPPPPPCVGIANAMQWELGGDSQKAWCCHISGKPLPYYFFVELETTTVTSSSSPLPPSDNYLTAVPDGTYHYLVRPSLKGFKSAHEKTNEDKAVVLGYLHSLQLAKTEGALDSYVTLFRTTTTPQVNVVNDVNDMVQIINDATSSLTP
jgi:hypothetical protein